MTALMPWERSGGKVSDRQLTRLAVVYVRQSSMQQVADHQESTRLQYALVDRAAALSWPASRVVVIDEDLGRSGASAVARSGFQRLVTEIGLDHVGLVLGIEMSRLARSGKDWYQLIGAPRSIANSCGDGRAPPPGRRSGRVKREAV
jgi:resolvase-like protein